MEKNKTSPKQEFGSMAGSVINSTGVLRLNFCPKLNICASISALRQARNSYLLVYDYDELQRILNH